VEADGPTRRPKWFTNKGQVIQTGIALAACIFGAVKAWPELKGRICPFRLAPHWKRTSRSGSFRIG